MLLLPTTNDDEYEYTEADKDALRRAMEMAMRDPSRCMQLTSKLLDEPWCQVAEFAAYSMQMETLKLKPWESPPCWGDDEDIKSSKLLDQMLAAGISQFEPDPVGALKTKGK